MSAVAEALASLRAALSAARLRWYVFGAQAIVLYGRPRLTADIDVTVEIQPNELPRLLEALQPVGFETRVADIDSFVARTRVLPLVHHGTGIPVDVVLAGTALEAEFLDRARRVGVEGIEVPVISPEDLLVTKLLAGRPKDREDAAGLIREQGSQLDLAQVRRLLSQIEEALDRSDLLPELERLLGAAPGTRTKGGRGGPRRTRRRK